MSFEVTAFPDHALVSGEDRLNMVTAPRVRDLVAGAVEQGFRLVVFDMSDVPFMDSTGLGALIAGAKAARQAGGELALVAPPDQVVMVLDLTNMNRVFPVYPTVAEAVATHG